jgi:hypothetical protein
MSIEDMLAQINQPMLNLNAMNGEATFALLVSRMLAIESASLRSRVLNMVYCLFFHIYSYGSMHTWTTRRRCHPLRAKPGSMREWYESYGCHLVAKQADFEAHISKWRSNGGKLAHIATQTSLGSLVLLHEQLADLWGATMGTEKDGVSVHAAQHLKSIGVTKVAKESGLDKLMSDMLWGLFRGLAREGWDRVGEDFPGFTTV